MARKNVVNPSGYHSSGRTLPEKANNFGAYVKQFGWAGSWKIDPETGNVILTANRGENEIIQIEWYKGGGGEVWYTLAGERIKCHNVSGAALIARNEPDLTRLKRAVSKKRKSMGKLSQDESAMLVSDIQGTLPFDHESDDVELKTVLMGRTITWLTSTGVLFTAKVGAGKKRNMFKVVRSNGKSYIDFVDEFGFHSVYLDRIVSVG